MQSHEAFDETFDPALSGGYDLLIVPSPQGVNVAVHDATRAQFLAHVSEPILTVEPDMWANTFAHILGRYSWLRAPFHSVRLGWRAELFTVVPEALFLEAEAKSLLSAMAPVRLLDIVYYNHLPGGAVLPFAVPSEMLEAARALQPQFAVIHPDASLLLLAHTLFRRGSGLLVHLDGHFATLTLLVRGQLHALLPVRVAAPADLLYRALALLEAHGLLPAETPFLLLGPGLAHAADPHQPDYAVSAAAALAVLQRYLPPMEVRLHVPTHPFSYLIERAKEHHLALFSMILCE